MPTLNWIGKDAVVNHHNDVPFRILDKKYTFVGNRFGRYDAARRAFGLDSSLRRFYFPHSGLAFSLMDCFSQLQYPQSVGIYNG